jgi:hypothetical protein
MKTRHLPLATLLFGLLVSLVMPVPSEARDRPGTPNKGTAGYCPFSFMEGPTMCVQFQNTASEKVGFWLDWTENGTHMSPDLSGRSMCMDNHSAQTYYCYALTWFQGRKGSYVNFREFPEGFRLRALLWNSEYCFRFRSVDQDGVISGDWSGYTCARTPPPPAPPGPMPMPRATGIAGSSGEGVVGGSTPFKLLMEWSNPPNDYQVGAFSIQFARDGRWVQVADVTPNKLKDRHNPEFVIENPPVTPSPGRTAIRVCAMNVSGQSCSGTTYLGPQWNALERARTTPNAVLVTPTPAVPTIRANTPVQPALVITPRPTVPATSATTKAQQKRIVTPPPH